MVKKASELLAEMRSSEVTLTDGNYASFIFGKKEKKTENKRQQQTTMTPTNLSLQYEGGNSKVTFPHSFFLFQNQFFPFLLLMLIYYFFAFFYTY